MHKEAQINLAVALRELGRIERTLFTLKWLRDPSLRRRVNDGLNKGEARHFDSIRNHWHLCTLPHRT